MLDMVDDLYSVVKTMEGVLVLKVVVVGSKGC